MHSIPLVTTDAYLRGEDVPVYLITLTHPTLAEPIKVGSFNKDHFGYDSYGNPVHGCKSRGDEYLYIPMSVTIPSRSSDSIENGSISISNIRRALVPLIRTLPIQNGYATLKLEVLLYDGTDESLDVVVQSLEGLEVNTVNYDEKAMHFGLQSFSLMSEPFPAHKQTAVYFPSLHGAVEEF